MKIRSHTGNMVEARVGMAVIVRAPDSSVRFKRATILAIDEDGSIQVEHSNGFNWVYADLCTMLHCPFQVGDRFERLYEVSGKWHEEGEITDITLHFAKHYPKLYRHASRDLRDAPGYEAGAASC